MEVVLQLNPIVLQCDALSSSAFKLQNTNYKLMISAQSTWWNFSENRLQIITLDRDCIRVHWYCIKTLNFEFQLNNTYRLSFQLT
jgi:hypothetical protein